MVSLVASAVSKIHTLPKDHIFSFKKHDVMEKDSSSEGFTFCHFSERFS